MAADWTFLTNHSHVLLSIGADPELTVREIAQQVGITERAAQRIVADLIDAGYLQAERIGRKNRYTVNGDLPLRHPLEARNPIRSLLALTAPPSKRSRKAAGSV